MIFLGVSLSYRQSFIPSSIGITLLPDSGQFTLPSGNATHLNFMGGQDKYEKLFYLIGEHVRYVIVKRERKTQLFFVFFSLWRRTDVARNPAGNSLSKLERSSGRRILMDGSVPYGMAMDRRQLTRRIICHISASFRVCTYTHLLPKKETRGFRKRAEGEKRSGAGPKVAGCITVVNYTENAFFFLFLFLLRIYLHYLGGRCFLVASTLPVYVIM